MINKKKGFTLIELILAMAISSIVLLSITQTFILSLHNYQRQYSVVSLEMDTRLFISTVSSDIKRADEVKIDGNTLIITRDSQPIIYIKEGTNIKRSSNVILQNASEFYFNITDGILEVLVKTKYKDQEYNLGVKFLLDGKVVSTWIRKSVKMKMGMY